MEKPALIRSIENLLGTTLEAAPVRTDEHLAGLMRVKQGCPKYQMDGDRLIGLNLAITNLTDEKWQALLALPGFEPSHLQALNLWQNQLTRFSLEKGLTQLRELDIEDNPLETPSVEILAQGRESVLRFLKDLEQQGTRELFEVKMLIVGEGKTGKTTLWNLLQNPAHPVPDPDQLTTVGIQIKEAWPFQHLDRPADRFFVNLWDFGGQEIQYMTHQFFLTRRSFYVLLADGRGEVANFPYWLQIIELLSCEPESKKRLPVLVVLNKNGVVNPKLPYDENTIEAAYPKLDIIKEEIDFKEKGKKLEALTETIQALLCRRIEHLPLVIPAYWDKVRQALHDLRSNKIHHITAKKFAQICVDAGISDPERQADLSQLLHDLGTIVHFQKDTSLADFIILNPQWALNAVYEIMKHEQVKDGNQGRFHHALLQEIWTKKGYSVPEQSKLQNLMLKNNLEVCFRATENGKEIFIAPQLLPESRPASFEWTDSTDTLRFVYHYPFMPKGLIGRLIVRLHEDIENRQGRKVVWENGAVVEKKNEHCRALVQFLDDREQGRKIIKIEVQGKTADERKNVLRDIRLELEGIHHRSFPALKVFRKIPCNCPQCKQSLKLFEHDLEQLEDNKTKHGLEAVAQCGYSHALVPVQKLLEGVFKEEEMARKMEPPGVGAPIFQITNKNEIIMPPNPTSPSNPSSGDGGNIFSYAAALVVVAGIVLVLLNTVDFMKALLGVVAMVLLIVVLGALQLKNDERLSEKSFIDLMGMVLKKVPPLSWFSKK